MRLPLGMIAMRVEGVGLLSSPYPKYHNRWVTGLLRMSWLVPLPDSGLALFPFACYMYNDLQQGKLEAAECLGLFPSQTQNQIVI